MRNKKVFQLLLAGFLLIVAGCGKSKFLDVNNDPNNPTDVPPKVLLPTAQIGTAFVNGNELGRVASLIVQHNAGTANQALGFDIYNLDGNFDNAWNFEIYSNVVSDLRTLIAKTETTSPAYSGIGKMLLAYVVSVATDLWGDVPYSEAGYGLQFPTPKFDKQEDIYQGNATAGIVSLFDLVRSGLTDLDKPSALVPTAADDLVFAGNLGNWRRTGNTLLLKFAMQISNANPTLSKSVIDQVIAGNNYINSNAQDLEVPFGSNVGSQSPIFSFNNVNRPTDQMLSNRFLALMQNQNDLVRLGKLYTSPGGVFTGFDNGSNVVPPPIATRSKYNTFVTGPDAGGRSYIRLLSNSQRAFILAEAAVILNTAGDANALYQEGIRANMTKVGMTTGEIDAYFLANPTIVTLTGTNEQKRRQIIIQKYISFVPNPIEAYNDFRRTGYPELILALNSAGDDPATIPKRYTYPPNEVARNPNSPKPRPLTNVKVWWGR
jgi:hypothetical protein